MNQTVAAYARVSTGGQTADSQLTEIRRFAQTRGLHISHEYVDVASGSSDVRPQFRRMMRDAHKRRFDALLFFALDRITRGGIRATLMHLENLESWGIRYYSCCEPEISNAGPLAEFFVSIRSYFARAERDRLSERTKAGLARAREEGKQIGRPAVVVNPFQLRKLRDEGHSLRQIAAKLKIGQGTVLRRLRAGAELENDQQGAHPAAR